MEIHNKLNAEQLKVVTNLEGMLRVISGPGTGKSTTCIHCIAEIINSGRALPENILAVTFTNKAANELKTRVKKMVGEAPHVSTIHSFCASVLRKFPPSGYSGNFIIMDETGQFISVNNLVRQLAIDMHPRYILEKLRIARNLRDINILKAEQLEDFYKIYMSNLQKRDIIDYDGLLTWCLFVLQNNQAALDFHQKKYTYILVDEFQDTSPIQLEIIKLLVEKNKNLLVVGDPDQSIYRFRGADVSIMVNLHKVFTDIKSFYLSHNYRSTKKIINAASNLIKQNKQRLNKPLWTKNPDGQNPAVFSFANETKEAEFIASYIQQQVKEGKKYQEFAVLYRVNYLGNEFETVFSKQDIPYQVVGGSSFYQRTEIRNVLAFFRLIHNPADNTAFLQVCSVLAQTNGSSYKNFKNQYTANYGINLIDVAYLAKENFIRELPDFLNEISKQKDLVEMYNMILAKTQYLQYLKKDKSTEGERKVDNLEELKSVLVKLRDDGRGLDDFLNLVDSVREESDKNSVKLMTIHAAKGLEFDTVFIVGVEQKMHPHFKAENEEDLEEERRLFYVAVTRAKNNLLITSPKERLLKGETIKVYPSPYIDELKIIQDKRSFPVKEKSSTLAKEDISEGSVVLHPFFGKGYIMELKESYNQTIVKIDFSGLIKDFILEYTPLKLY